MTEKQAIYKRPTIAPSIGRIAVVLFLSSLLLLFLYALGTAQRFEDATLFWLLGVLEVWLVLSAAFMLCSCFLYMVHTVAGRWRFAAVPTILSLLAAAAALLLLASLRIISALLGDSPALPVHLL